MNLYQCKKCLEIVTSDKFLEKNLENQLICQQQNLNLSQQIVSSNDFDSYCVYKQILCKCQNPIGKIYLTVNLNVQNLLNKIVLNRNSLIEIQIFVEKQENQKENKQEIKENIQMKLRFAYAMSLFISSILNQKKIKQRTQKIDQNCNSVKKLIEDLRKKYIQKNNYLR